MAKKRFVKIKAHILANTGSVAFLSTTSDQYVIIKRGWTPGYQNMFPADFFDALKIGEYLTIATDGVRCRVVKQKSELRPVAPVAKSR